MTSFDYNIVFLCILGVLFLNPFTPRTVLSQNLAKKFKFHYYLNPKNQKVLLNSTTKKFHLHGHTIGFHPQTQKVGITVTGRNHSM